MKEEIVSGTKKGDKFNKFVLLRERSYSRCHQRENLRLDSHQAFIQNVVQRNKELIMKEQLHEFGMD